MIVFRCRNSPSIHWSHSLPSLGSSGSSISVYSNPSSTSSSNSLNSIPNHVDFYGLQPHSPENHQGQELVTNHSGARLSVLAQSDLSSSHSSSPEANHHPTQGPAKPQGSRFSKAVSRVSKLLGSKSASTPSSAPGPHQGPAKPKGSKLSGAMSKLSKGASKVTKWMTKPASKLGRLVSSRKS